MLIRMILYILLCLYGSVFCVLYDRYITMAAVMILAAMPVISFVFTCIASHFVEITIAGEKTSIHKNEEFEIKIIINNHSFIPVPFARIFYQIGYLEVPKAEWGKIQDAIPARKSIEHRITLTSGYSGMIMVGSSHVKLYDLFRIFHITKKCRKGFRQIVLPEIRQLKVDIKNKPVLTEQEAEEYYEDRSGNDPAQVFDIREYREGDKLQRIHWKLSSKKDELLVKELSEPIIVDTLVIFDTYCEENGMDAVVTRSILYDTAVNLSYTLIMKEISHYVIWLNRGNKVLEKKRISSEEDLYHVIYEMGQLGSYKEQNVFLKAFVTLEQPQSYSSIFYIGNNVKGFMDYGIHAEVVN